MKAFLKSWKFWSLLALVAAIAAGTVLYQFKLIDLSGKPAALPSGSMQSSGNPSASEAAAETSATAPAQVAENRSVVSIVRSKEAKVEDIKYDEIKQMVTDAVNLAGGFEGLIKDGQTVVIKPNLVTIKDYTLPNWDGKPCATEASGNATDWRVTKAVVELVRQYNPNGTVYVMEGSAANTEDAFLHYKYTADNISGVTAFLPIEKDSGGWRDYESTGIIKITPKNPMLFPSYYLNKKYATCDVLISLPCLKTHWSALVSCAVKNVAIGSTPANIYGMAKDNNGRNNMVDHNTDDFNKWINDWILCRPINFVIVDGLQGIQNGPTPCYEMSGTTDIKQDQKNERIIMAGRDAIAVDAVAAQVMNWDPYSVNYLKYLEKSGAGNVNAANIRVVGNPVEEVRQDFATVKPSAETAVKISDFQAPVFKINEAVIASGQLSIIASSDNSEAGRTPSAVPGSFDAFLPSAKDACKFEIYIDGKYSKTIIPTDFKEFNILVPEVDLKAKQTEVVIYAFDRFFNRAKCAVLLADGKVSAVVNGSDPLNMQGADRLAKSN